jgi:hypothetical protein
MSGHLGDCGWRRAAVNTPVGYAGSKQDPYYSGKHHRHGVNLSKVIGLNGELRCCVSLVGRSSAG